MAPTPFRGAQVMEGDSALSQVGVINRVTAGLAAVDVSTLYVSTYATDLILVPRYALGDALGLLHAQSEAVLSGAPGPVGTPPPAQPPTAASTSLHLSPIPGSLRVMRAPRALRAPLAFAAMRALFFPHTTPGLVDARSPSHRAAYCAWIECGDEITVVLPVALWPAFRDSAAAGGVGVHVADASAGAGADSGGGATGGVGDGEASGGGAREGSEGGDGAAAAGAAASSPQHRALVVHDVEWAAIHVAKGAVPLSDSLLISSLARGLAHANVRCCDPTLSPVQRARALTLPSACPGADFLPERVQPRLRTSGQARGVGRRAQPQRDHAHRRRVRGRAGSLPELDRGLRLAVTR